MASRDEHFRLSEDSLNSSNSQEFDDLNYLVESQLTTKTLRSNNDSLLTELPIGSSIPRFVSLITIYSSLILFAEESIVSAFVDSPNKLYLLLTTEALYKIAIDFSSHDRWPLCHIISFFIVPSKFPSPDTTIAFLLYKTLYTLPSSKSDNALGYYRKDESQLKEHLTFTFPQKSLEKLIRKFQTIFKGKFKSEIDVITGDLLDLKEQNSSHNQYYRIIGAKYFDAINILRIKKLKPDKNPCVRILVITQTSLTFLLPKSLKERRVYSASEIKIISISKFHNSLMIFFLDSSKQDLLISTCVEELAITLKSINPQIIIIPSDLDLVGEVIKKPKVRRRGRLNKSGNSNNSGDDDKSLEMGDSINTEDGHKSRIGLEISPAKSQSTSLLAANNNPIEEDFNGIYLTTSKVITYKFKIPIFRQFSDVELEMEEVKERKRRKVNGVGKVHIKGDELSVDKLLFLVSEALLAEKDGALQ